MLAVAGMILAVPALAQQSNLITLESLATTQVDDAPANGRGDLLLASDGNLYFASFAGGSNGGGAVARVALDGTLTVLGSLTGSEGLGAQPYAPLIQASDGNLYGTTYVGGRNGRGTVFKATLAGQVTTLHTFTEGKGEPLLPYTGLVQAPDGNLYGTTMRGGASDAGTVFRLTLTGEFTVLHEFSGKDGQNPEGTLVVGPDGNLYGTTLIGGDNDRGTIYRISATGTLTSLYSFPALGAFSTAGLAINTTGANPRSALLLASDGNFYGTAYQGGANGHGTVFRLTPSGAVSVVHDFAGPPSGGGFPLSGLREGDPGVLYGTTERGGHINIGSAYRLTTDGAFTLLHSFAGSGDDGQSPYATLLPLNGELFGVSYSDSAIGRGAVFKLVLPQDGTLPVQLSATPFQLEFGGSVTLSWSSPTAAACITGGAWNSTIGASGAEVITPPVPGYYTYVLTCTDAAGVVRNAYANVLVTSPERETVDGGAGGGATSPWMLLLLAALLISIRLRKTGEVR
jgi:uncharacterized repeat protein (TIGR03803 family)